MPKELPACTFTDDGVTTICDQQPPKTCANCGLPKTHPRHALPTTPDGVTRFEDRRTGERNDH